MKPIEPGCLCLIVESADTASIGTTAIAIEECGGDSKGAFWFIDDGTRALGGGYWSIPGRYLMRIDGHEPETQEVKQVAEVE